MVVCTLRTVAQADQAVVQAGQMLLPVRAGLQHLGKVVQAEARQPPLSGQARAVAARAVWVATPQARRAFSLALVALAFRQASRARPQHMAAVVVVDLTRHQARAVRAAEVTAAASINRALLAPMGWVAAEAVLAQVRPVSVDVAATVLLFFSCLTMARLRFLTRFWIPLRETSLSVCVVARMCGTSHRHRSFCWASISRQPSHLAASLRL